MKEDEMDWFSKMTEDEIENSINLPFVDTWCGGILADIGAILYLLPKKPCTLLDVGVGGGWSSWFYAKAGYDVTGIDISQDWISLISKRWKNPNLKYKCVDFESLEGEFGAIVMHDTLHHADDPQVWINKAYDLLPKKGVLITCEPGSTHSQQPDSIAASERFGVNENDMGVQKVKEMAKRAGFRDIRLYPSAKQAMYLMYIGAHPVYKVYEMDTGLVRLEK